MKNKIENHEKANAEIKADDFIIQSISKDELLRMAEEVK